MLVLMLPPCNAMLSYDLHHQDKEVAAGTLLFRTGLYTERYSHCMYLITMVTITLSSS